jgi:hypothetical protein
MRQGSTLSCTGGAYGSSAITAINCTIQQRELLVANAEWMNAAYKNANRNKIRKSVDENNMLECDAQYLHFVGILLDRSILFGSNVPNLAASANGSNTRPPFSGNRPNITPFSDL